MELTELKSALHIDGDEDDSQLERFLTAAEHRIQGMIGTNYPGFYEIEGNKQEYEIALIMLVDHWNKTRSATSEKQLTEIPFGVRTFVLSLRPAYQLYSQVQEETENVHS
ncbi:head-tail connector protein [Furfurilactobacillus entadae]|uniref:head-tail connector protein n=1 Tax=Furfurilactobacillus entadae TaxID=2922307 RepID=UPI0035EC79F9